MRIIFLPKRSLRAEPNLTWPFRSLQRKAIDLESLLKSKLSPPLKIQSKEVRAWDLWTSEN